MPDKPSISVLSSEPPHDDGNIHSGDAVTFATAPAFYDGNPVTLYATQGDDETVIWSMMLVGSQRTETVGAPAGSTITAVLYGSRGKRIVDLADVSFDLAP